MDHFPGPPPALCSARPNLHSGSVLFFRTLSAEPHQPLDPQSPLYSVATRLQLTSLSFLRPQILLRHVPERPPPVHPRRRRHLCHEQSRSCTSKSPPARSDLTSIQNPPHQRQFNPGVICGAQLVSLRAFLSCPTTLLSLG